MKTLNNLKFGFSAVNAGQRGTNYEPQFIATSTEGGFRVTPPVSKILGLIHGGYVMFINNVANIDIAIRDKDETIVKFCEDNGLELGSPEALVAIHKEFDIWGIAKGIKEYDTKGNVKTTPMRITKNDRYKYVKQNFDDMLSEAMQHGDDELKDALSRDGITEEEQINLLAPFVVPNEVSKYKGSKLANPAGMSGSNISLNFTDSNVWKTLKSDLGEEATNYNRIFDVDIKNIVRVQVNNGFENVEVPVLILGDYVDNEPSPRGSNEDDEE